MLVTCSTADSGELAYWYQNSNFSFFWIMAQNRLEDLLFAEHLKGRTRHFWSSIQKDEKTSKFARKSFPDEDYMQDVDKLFG